MQLPQWSQSSLSSIKPVDCIITPLPIPPSAFAPTTSSHILTHLSQWIHLLWFFTITGLNILSLSWNLRFHSLNPLCLGPDLNTKFCSSHSPPLSQVGQSSGWFASKNSSMDALADFTVSFSVNTSMP